MKFKLLALDHNVDISYIWMQNIDNFLRYFQSYIEFVDLSWFELAILQANCHCATEPMKIKCLIISLQKIFLIWNNFKIKNELVGYVKIVGCSKRKVASFPMRCSRGPQTWSWTWMLPFASDGPHNAGSRFVINKLENSWDVWSAAAWSIIWAGRYQLVGRGCHAPRNRK